MATSSATQPLLVAGSVIAVLGLGYLAMGSKSSSTDERDIVLSDLDDELAAEAGDEHISAEEVTKIFDRLYRELQAIFAQLMQNIQMIRMQGQNIPEAQVMALVQKEMINALQAKQAQALEEFEMDESCFEEATWEFLEQNHPAVTKSVDRFQKFWGNLSGQDDLEGWRPGRAPVEIETLSPERTIEIAQVYFDSLTQKMRELVAEYKDAGKDLKQPAVQQQLNMDFGQHAQKSGEDALKAAGTTMKIFEHSVKAHSGNATVNRAIQQIQMQQQQELMGIGNS